MCLPCLVNSILVCSVQQHCTPSSLDLSTSELPALVIRVIPVKISQLPLDTDRSGTADNRDFLILYYKVPVCPPVLWSESSLPRYGRKLLWWPPYLFLRHAHKECCALTSRILPLSSSPHLFLRFSIPSFPFSLLFSPCSSFSSAVLSKASLVQESQQRFIRKQRCFWV